jgi:hypothetical protein
MSPNDFASLEMLNCLISYPENTTRKRARVRDPLIHIPFPSCKQTDTVFHSQRLRYFPRANRQVARSVPQTL